MSVLRPAESTARLFVGLFGQEGAGKTYTATEIAIAGRAALGLEGPIAFFDTERGARFRALRVKEATGQDLLVMEDRTIAGLKSFFAECAKTGVSVAIVDSMTHVIEDLRTTYFAKRDIEDPEPGDYSKADKPFKELLNKMLSANLNIIGCARESQVWGRYKNSKGKMVNGPIGVKFGAGKAGYEFDLLLRMEREDKKEGGVERKCLIVKDRSASIVHGEGGVVSVPFDTATVLRPFFAASGAVCK